MLRRLPATALVVLVSIAAWLEIVGCSTAADGGVGQACPEGTCPSGLICAPTVPESTCQSPCQSSSDCAHGLVCNAGTPAYCLPPCSGDGSVPAAGLNPELCVGGVPTDCAHFPEGGCSAEGGLTD